MKRCSGPDILRALAITAVIGLHVISYEFRDYPLPTPQFHLLLFLDQLLRFCVPLFVALSGYLLATKYQEGLNLKDFFVRRILRIIPSYLYWSFFIYLFLHFVPPWSQFKNDTPLWTQILFGRAEYHLYFVPMIMVLYLLFPVLLSLTKKFSWLAVVVVFTLQFWLYSILSSGRWSDQEQYLFFGTWLGYFLLGIYLAGVRARARVRGSTFTVILICCALLGMGLGLKLALDNSYGIISRGTDLVIATKFTRWPVIIYAGSFIFLALSTMRWLEKLPARIVSILSRIGQYSFLIYLSHTLLLRIYFEGPKLHLNPALAPVLYLAVATAVLFSLWLKM